MTHPVDAHVGMRLRRRRLMKGMTQQTLAKAIGIKFQQVQKYESGANRISASRLWDIARELKVSVSFFFVGLDAALATNDDRDDDDQMPLDSLDDRNALEFLRAYYLIPQSHRPPILALLKANGVNQEARSDVAATSRAVWSMPSAS